MPQAVGIFPQFIAQQAETIVLKEHVLSLTGDSFSIKLANGTPILQVEGKVFSLGGRKKVRDMAGNHLFDIKKEHLHIHTTFAILDPQGTKIMEVKSSFARKFDFLCLLGGVLMLALCGSVFHYANTHAAQS